MKYIFEKSKFIRIYTNYNNYNNYKDNFRNLTHNIQEQ